MLCRTGQVVLALVLFAQAAQALSGCLMPAAEFPQVVAARADADSSGCGMNLNLCLVHCSAGDQTLDLNSIPTILPVLAVVLFVAQTEPRLPSSLAIERIQRVTDPPIPIRFCSYLI